MRASQKVITELKRDEIFVFGSNMAGRHGKGAAKQAMKFGAIYGKSQGIQGNTYAIPTKEFNVKYSRTIEDIQKSLDSFFTYATFNFDKTFLVTEIGCGLAGYKASEIAPLFKEALEIKNIHLPITFLNILGYEF